MGCCPPSGSRMASRACPSTAAPCWTSPWPSGPRCARAPTMSRTRPGSACDAEVKTMPAMPHISANSPEALDRVDDLVEHSLGRKRISRRLLDRHKGVDVGELADDPEPSDRRE